MDATKNRPPIPWQKQIVVPAVCLVTGALSYGLSLLLAARMDQATAFYMGAGAALLLFLLSGLLFLRRLRQDEIIRSAAYVTLYYFLLFVVAQEFAARGTTLPKWLLFPVWPFTYLHTALLKLGLSNMFALAPALLSPLFYAMFGKPRIAEGERPISAKPAEKEQVSLPEDGGEEETSKE